MSFLKPIIYWLIHANPIYTARFVQPRTGTIAPVAARYNCSVMIACAMTGSSYLAINSRNLAMQLSVSYLTWIDLMPNFGHARLTTNSLPHGASKWNAQLGQIGTAAHGDVRPSLQNRVLRRKPMDVYRSLLGLLSGSHCLL